MFNLKQVLENHREEILTDELIKIIVKSQAVNYWDVEKYYQDNEGLGQ